MGNAKDRKMKVTRRAFNASVAAAAGASYFATPVLANQTITIGVLGPISGNNAADGEEMVRGAKMAVEELNAAGGVAGYNFEIATGDTQNQSADSVTGAVERLISNKSVHAVFAGYASSNNFEIELMADANMPYLLSGGSAQTRDIIAPKPDDFPTVWSLTPSYDAYETEIVPVLDGLVESGKLNLPSKTVALISSDNPYSKTIYEGMKKSFTEAGWTVTLEDLVPFGEINDWRAFLAKVRQDPPAVLINTDYVASNAATFMNQFMEQPTNSLVFIQYAPSVPEFIELTKEKSTGVLYNLLGGPLYTPKNPRADELAGKFKAKFGVESGFYGIALYEQVLIYADALKAVGDPAKHLEIGKAIGATKKPVAQGMLEFDPATHLARQGNDFIPIQFYQIRDGKRVLVYPAQYATGDFQQPGWMK